MPPTTSTIVVMGSTGSSKSEFIKLLAKPINIQPNDSNTENRKAITVSPYIEDGQIVKLVEFPSFSVNLTAAEHLVDIAEFLEIQRKHQRAISGVIYVHRVTKSGSQSPDEDRNLKMLSHILGDDAMKNVVVATDGWEQLANTKQSTFKTMFSFPSQFKRYDGTKLSALCVLDSILQKIPKQLRIQIELGADQDIGSTTAGQYLIECVNEIMTANQAEDMQIRKDIATARKAKDKDKVKALQDKLANLGHVLDRLRAEQNKLEASVNSERAEIDNVALDEAVNEWYESVTTDWKAKYDELLVEHNELKDGFPLKLRVTGNWNPDQDTMDRNPTWLPYTRDEILWAKCEAKKAIYNENGQEYLVCCARNAAGKIGWIQIGKVAMTE